MPAPIAQQVPVRIEDPQRCNLLGTASRRGEPRVVCGNPQKVVISTPATNVRGGTVGLLPITDTVSRFTCAVNAGGWLLATSVELGAARDQGCHELVARIDDVFLHQPAHVGVPPSTHSFEDLGVFDVGMRAPLRHFGKEVTWQIE